MKTSTWRRLIRSFVQPRLPELKLTKEILHFDPVDDLLRGFTLDTSAFAKEKFAVWAFVQPLYIPKPYLWFNYGIPLGHAGNESNEWWYADAGNEAKVMDEVATSMKLHGVPYLESVATAGEIAHLARDRLVRNPRNANNLEVQAYSEILSGELDLAAVTLQRLLNETSGPDGPKWFPQMHERAERVMEALEMGEGAVVEVLHRWRDETAVALGFS